MADLPSYLHLIFINYSKIQTIRSNNRSDDVIPQTKRQIYLARHCFLAGHGRHRFCIIATSAQIPTEQAQQIAYDLAQSMTAHWGGSMLYVPKTNPEKILKRNLAIWNDFTGNNHHQLAQKYDLATPTVYQILALAIY